jgi:hypothetical protein
MYQAFVMWVLEATCVILNTYSRHETMQINNSLTFLEFWNKFKKINLTTKHENWFWWEMYSVNFQIFFSLF